MLRLTQQSIRPLFATGIYRGPTTLFYTTTTETASSVSDTVTDQFIRQISNKRTKKPIPTSDIVVIEGMPTTGTIEDIRKVAREAFDQGDKSIREVIFCRRNDFKFFGRCVVQMDSKEHAGKLVNYGNMRMIGGSHIKVKMGGQETANSKDYINRLRRQELVSVTDATSASGRTVLVNGLPPKTTVDQLFGILRSKNLFPVEGSSRSVIPLRSHERSIVSKYLVKFDSESEAWRCVRAFHNTKFNLKARNSDYHLDVSVVY
ncbi:hypothetical protein DM01DRAFT_1387099 [Hesseltinella vesiculosa]|uniref:RRM domain-containing protein n=1 Tax=Hesseltinella vesiculosa TaxID=101127 RepID=A0A1X2G3D7_9FUNG|nr:hypothetical protein DM01DRAFT_1387099 [Hesseltinella vesiculosa]